MRRLAILVCVLGIVPAVAQDGPFGPGLFQVLEKAGCRSCHAPDGVASATRLHFPEPDAAPERIEAFGRSLVTLIDRERPDASLLLNKPTNRVTHVGGERIKAGSEDEAALQEWIKRLTRLSGDELASALKYREQEFSGGGHEIPRNELRRLTHSQYNHTVRDLLGDQTTPSSQFPPEDFVNGFRNQTQSQALSPLLVEAYSAAAERLARNAFRGGDIRGLIPCSQASPACRARFVREFGLKAFRRPLEPSEQQRYEALMAGRRTSSRVRSLLLRRCSNPRVSSSISTRVPIPNGSRMPWRAGFPLRYGIPRPMRSCSPRRRVVISTLPKAWKGPPDECSMTASTRVSGRVCQPVDALRPHFDSQQRPAEVPAVHA